MKRCSIPIYLSVLATACQPSGGELDLPSWRFYRNPVYADSKFPDPGVMRDADGTFYAYSTTISASAICPAMRSDNLVDWEYLGSTFDGKPAVYIAGASMWAPEVARIGGRYVMYYALSGSSIQETGIAVAVSDSPEGPFQDLGCLIDAQESGVPNSIDPSLYEEDGHRYLVWGSFGGGIWAVELSDDGLSVRPGAEKVALASENYEAACIVRRNGYYYLFASPRASLPCGYPPEDYADVVFPDPSTAGNTGVQTTYRVVYGRSEHLWGPYVTRAGGRMLDNYHEYLIGPGTVFAGPGHNATLVTDDAGDDWMLYHAYTIGQESVGRVLFLDRIEWKDGWPSVRRRTPSSMSDAPYFNDNH